MSQHNLVPREVQYLQEVLKADTKTVNIRLRQGEYQYDLAKGMASFQLELRFPNVKDIIERLYGEEKTNDTPFIRKIQTILKKMEKSNVVKILPKKNPWELQRYALSSFSFQDTDKNLVTLAKDQEIKQSQNLLHSMLNREETTAKPINFKAKIFMLAFIVVASYMAILWDLMQPSINPIIFIPAFSVAAICSLILGKTLS